MKRLKLELKQTMDMYSSACKEAISAKNKVNVVYFLPLNKIFKEMPIMINLPLFRLKS